MAQAIQDILNSLDAGYNPQRQAINAQIDQLPSQANAQVAGLQQQQKDSFNDITNGARDRGIGFSGIPLAEQAHYTASSFLPAVAKVQESQNLQKTSLTDALNGINLDQRKTAFGIQSGQLDREQQQAQFDRQQAAALEAARQARASAGGGDGGLGALFGGGGAAPAPQNKTAQAQQRPNGGGYNFQAANGQPISAAQYAQLKGIPFRDVLQTMAKSGDKGAKIALDYVGNDFGVNRGKVKINASALPQLPGLLNSLLGGVNKY